jgi:hypothetical protein
MTVEELSGRVRRFALPSIRGVWNLCRAAPGLGMKRAIVGTAACILFGAMSLFAQGEQEFKGQVCLGPEGRTPIIQNGQATLPCTIKHPKRGAKYILFNPKNKTSYQLEGHLNPKAFAGTDVVVLGVLDQTTGTIHIDQVFRGLSPKIVEAKSAYIECDACPRGMAAAWRAAFQELEDWGKYDVTPDPKKADLVFIFSANPYLGDYVTRDGPDKRPVSVNITYMNVVDPETGENLWGDSREWGSLRVASATRDLIEEFRLQLAEQSQSNPQSLVDKRHNRKASPNGDN